MLPTRTIYFCGKAIGYLEDGQADTFWVSGQWKPIANLALDEFLDYFSRGYPLVHIGKPESVLYGEVLTKPTTTIEIKLTS